jgi:hypothetical protein
LEFIKRFVGVCKLPQALTVTYCLSVILGGKVSILNSHWLCPKFFKKTVYHEQLSGCDCQYAVTES